MEKMEIFRNEEFGEIRTMVINEEPWFVGKDIAEKLGYSNPRDAIRKHVDTDDKGVSKCDTLGGSQKLTIINESGLYSLILSSKLESAKRFKRWVTSEVLPTIRKTGGYINNVDLMVNTYFSDVPDTQKTLVKGLLTNIEGLQNKNKLLNNENDLLAQKILQWADRPLINALVRSYGASIGDFRTAWTSFKKELLYKHGINLNSRITNFLNTSGKKTKPKTLEMLDDSEIQKALSTAVSICREHNVDISSLLDKKTES